MWFWILLILGTLCLGFGLASLNNGGYWVGYPVGFVLIVVAAACFFGAYRIHKCQKHALAATVQLTPVPMYSGHFLCLILVLAIPAKSARLVFGAITQRKTFS